MSIFPPVTKDHLAAIHVFEGLDDDTLEAVAQRSIAIGAHAGARLVNQGESGFDFYMIHGGEASVEMGGQEVATLGPGDVFGEMALLGHRRRSADVVAKTQMSLITMMVWDFRQVLEEHPEVGHRLRSLAEERLSGG